jgi:hypothetical protein
MTLPFAGVIEAYETARKAIFEHVGYVEDWVVIPLDDCREMFWRVDPTEKETCDFAKTEAELASESGDYYEDEIYTQRFLPKWVYRGAEITIVCCNPRTDGNKFLRIFDNEKERPWPTER